MPATSPWPADRVPFPVTAPFRMRPGLQRLGGSLGTLLAPDDGARSSAQAVEQAIARQRLPVLGAPGDETIAPALIEAARLQIVQALDEHEGVAAGQAAASGGRAREQIIALRRSVQDDLVLMAAAPDGPRGGMLRASVLAVAMPSGWDPQTKLGQDFQQIHAPVADAEQLRAAAQPLSAALLTRPFCRYVWTLSNSPALSAHPADRQADPQTDRAHYWRDLWFRSERQITVPLPGAIGVLFLIRVFVAPLPAVLAVAPARAPLLVQALQTMSPAVQAYKGLTRWRGLVLEALASA